VEARALFHLLNCCLPIIVGFAAILEAARRNLTTSFPRFSRGLAAGMAALNAGLACALF
jgi:hypothetical protein